MIFLLESPFIKAFACNETISGLLENERPTAPIIGLSSFTFKSTLGAKSILKPYSESCVPISRPIRSVVKRLPFLPSDSALGKSLKPYLPLSLFTAPPSRSILTKRCLFVYRSRFEIRDFSSDLPTIFRLRFFDGIS